jgi:hypothetical protein
MDTDSLFINVKGDQHFDLYKDLDKMQDELDTSDYPTDHPLYSVANKKVLGKFKDELNGEIITEACFIRSKMYSYKTLTSEKRRLKGVSRVALHNQITHEDYVNCLLGENSTRVNVSSINNKNHEMYLMESKKRALNPFDDKRFLINNIHTEPFTNIKEAQ